MGNNIKLTIGIPVYNGDKFIEKAIESILKQVDDTNRRKIEILISDNASEDKTSEIVKKYLMEHIDLIKYYKNEKNLGYDKNIDLIVERAEGEYVWFLGCGEVLKEGSINKILFEIEKDRYDNILLNFDIFSEELGKIELENNFQIYDNEIIELKEEFWNKTKTGITPVSANIVLRKAYLEIIDKKLREIGWVHVERIIDILARKDYKKSLWISESCFILYREIDGWWSKKGNLLLNMLKLLKIFNSMEKKGYLENTIKELKKVITIKNFIGYVILAKKQGLKFNKNLRKEIKEIFSNEIKYWLIILPIILMPSIIIEKFLWLKKVIKKCQN